MIRVCMVLGLATVLWACAPVDMPEPPEGAVLFSENCAVCHGNTGRGDGPWSAGMKPAPSDLTQLEANNSGHFPRVHVLSVIDGYDRTGLPGQDMPEFGLLLRGNTVPIDVGDGVFTPTPRPLAALLAYLESLQV